jgi:hypothetical protein
MSQSRKEQKIGSPMANNFYSHINYLDGQFRPKKQMTNTNHGVFFTVNTLAKNIDESKGERKKTSWY